MKEILGRVFSRHGKKYMSLAALVRKCTAPERRALGLEKTASPSRNAQLFEELPLGYRLWQKGGVPYLIQGKPDEVVLSEVYQQPGVSVGALAKRLPFRKAELRDMINRLLESCEVMALISKTDKILLHPGLLKPMDFDPLP